MYKYTHEQFLEKLHRTNENFRSGIFSVEGVYQGDSKPVLLRNKYGLCQIVPNNLYTGSRPNISSAVNKSEYFANMAKERHGDKYDYSLVDYKSTEEKVAIVCPIHGVFYQTPHTHLDRSGCTKCGRATDANTKDKSNTFSLDGWINSAEKSKHFDVYKVYIVRLFDDNEDFIKIGRTFTKTQKRLDPIPYNVEEIKNWIFHNPDQAFDLENEIKKVCKDFRYKPQKSFGGMYECYDKSVIEETTITHDVGIPDVVLRILEFEYGKS